MTPKTAFLHIGTPKTGTTSIQNWLAAAGRRGELRPVRYPLYRSDVNQSRLITFYRPDQVPGWMRSEFPANDERFQAWRRRYRKFIFDQLRAAPGAVLSAEALSDFTAPEVARLRADLESLGYGQFHIVLYIRDPADFYLSLVQQRLKATLKPPLPEDPRGFTYGFRRIAEAWEQGFPGRLIVRPYRTGPDQDVVADIGALLRQHMGVSPQRTPLRLNRTLSAEGMRILQDYRLRFCSDNDNLMTPDAVRLLRFLERSTEHVPQTRPALKAAVAEQIRANHRADVELISSRYGMDLKLPEPEPCEPLPDRTTYRIDDILESVDPGVVQQLLLRLARTELGSPSADGSVAVRAATRAYRAIPPGWLSPRLEAWLRSLRNGNS